MAMQAGIGVSRIILIAGAGYTGTILMKNGKLSDVLGELQKLVKGLEKTEEGDGDSDYSEVIAAQCFYLVKLLELNTSKGAMHIGSQRKRPLCIITRVRRLAMEVRQLASSRPITVLNGTSYQSNVASLVVPACALGAVGYGYMWWKGLSFSDLMYVTKQNMANAVSNLTKHLEHVSEALAATKRHLTQRIENLDGKLDEQVEISKLIRNEVNDVRGDLSQIGFDLDELQRMVSGLDGKLLSLEDKQELTNAGVMYLCNLVNGRKVRMPERLQDQLNITGKALPSLMGLKEIADSLSSGTTERSLQDGSDKLNKTLTRALTTKC